MWIARANLADEDLAAKEAAPKGKGAVLLRWADRVLSR